MYKRFRQFIFIVLSTLVVLIVLCAFVLESSSPSDARSVVVDDLGNIYLLHDTHIERKSLVGKEYFRSSDFNYGPVEVLDITNPLKPFLHFRQAGKLVFFDNTLSQQGEAIDLFNQNIGQIELIAGSRGDFFWLWESVNSEMIRADKNFQKISSSGNLSFLLGRELHPEMILERGDHVYLMDPVHGVLVFDIYGTYQTTLKIFPRCGLQSVNNQLIYLENNQIFVLGSDWITSESIDVSGEKVISLSYSNQKIFLLRNGFLEVWKE
jgi:glutaredoxin-related protein